MDTERRMTTQEMLTQHKKLMDESQRLEPSVIVTERNWSALLEMQDRLFRQQMQLGNFNLFFVSIAAQLDNLQTVQQSRRNSIYGICRYNPEYMRQIKREFNKVITEAVVLLRIKNL